MNTFKLFCVCVACAAAPTAFAQTAKTEHGIPDAPTTITNSPTSETGSLIKYELKWRSKVPLDKTWDQFSPEEKADFRSMYKDLPDADEPPFPADTLKPIFEAIKKGQHILRARGEINFTVTVNADGEATRLDDFHGVKGVNAYEMTNLAATALVKARYKPGMCAGKPCTMQFPFKLPLK